MIHAAECYNSPPYVAPQGLTGDLLNAARLDFDLVHDDPEQLGVQQDRVQSLQRTAELFQSRLRSVQLRRGRFAQKLLKSKMAAMKESLQDVFKKTDSSHQAQAKAVSGDFSCKVLVAEPFF